MAPDPRLQASVDAYLGGLEQELDVEIGSTAVELDSRRRVVRSRESAFANLLADAMRAATGAEVALTNGGGIRADKIYPGQGRPSCAATSSPSCPSATRQS